MRRSLLLLISTLAARSVLSNEKNNNNNNIVETDIPIYTEPSLINDISDRISLLFIAKDGRRELASTSSASSSSSSSSSSSTSASSSSSSSSSSTTGSSSSSASSEMGNFETFVVYSSTFDILCHFASFLETVAFLQHSLIGLRVFECAAAFLVTIYALLHTSNWIDCHFLWGGLHFCVNAYFLIGYYKTHLSAKFTEEVKTLMQEGGEFDMFNRVEMVALTSKCGFKFLNYKKGEKILIGGEPVERLLFAIKGKIRIQDKETGAFIALLDISLAGCQWLGEMSYYTGDAASATLVADSDDCRFLSWDMHKMRHASHSHSHSVDSVVFRQLPSLFASQLAGRTARLSRDLAVGRKDSARMAKALANTKVTPVAGTKRTKSQLKKRSTMQKRLEASGQGENNSDVERAMAVLEEVEQMSELNKNKWKRSLAKHKTIQAVKKEKKESKESDNLLKFGTEENDSMKTWT